MGNIELIDVMGDDLRVANVARVSFAKWKDEFDGNDVRLIDFLARNEHTSPFRHTAVTLRCKAPIFLSRQLMKHQVGMSWNEESRRYVDYEPDFHIPSEWRARPEDGIKQGSAETIVDTVCWQTPNGEVDFTEPQQVYAKAVDYAMSIYTGMLSAGIAPEMARMVLPQSMNINWVWTGSLLSFFHVYRLRIDGHAQKEAQEFAQELENILKPIFPHCWEALKNG